LERNVTLKFNTFPPWQNRPNPC